VKNHARLVAVPWVFIFNKTLEKVFCTLFRISECQGAKNKASREKGLPILYRR